MPEWAIYYVYLTLSFLFQFDATLQVIIGLKKCPAVKSIQSKSDEEADQIYREEKAQLYSDL